MLRINALNMQLNPTSEFQNYVWSYSIPPFHDFQKVGNAKGLTVVISGASRGIGLAIGKRLAQDGANVVILAKTATPHPKLPGTIATACKEIEEAGGKALGIQCDIRSEEAVKSAIEQAVAAFGGIDILVNNASAISLTDTESTKMKKYDLMHQVNTRGTFLISKYCIPHLKKSKNPHILNISPPLTGITSLWFAPHVAYSMAKFGMSLQVLGMSTEFKDDRIAVNALWPKTSIATSAVKFVLGGDAAISQSRTVEIMADSAYVILTSDSRTTTGKFFLDDEVLANVGVVDFEKYKVDPRLKDYQLTPDYFI